MAALVETDIKPPEVEVSWSGVSGDSPLVKSWPPPQARMVALCLGVGHLVGLVQLLDGSRQQVGHT
jgi:hypothetical protein